MRKQGKKYGIILAVLLIASFACMYIADMLQRDFGGIDIQMGCIETEQGELTYKLYVPESATASAPAPGVLLLHGYQNDHETSAAYAVEMARRGAVVLALDEYGHGSTSIGMAVRGYTNHKVTVTYGNDSEADGTYVSIGGQLRYRVMMNFSNLSFFNDRYSSDSDGNRIEDSSMGGISAYALLASLDCTDPSRLAISGHSMGTWASWSTAAAYAGTEVEPRATVLQCGELFRDSVYDTEAIHFNNVLLLQAKWDEFNYFRDYKDTVTDELLRSELRCEFLDCAPAEAAWNTTYGDFADGSARRMELLYTNHRLTTHDGHGMKTAVEWMTNAIGLNTELASDSHTYAIKEWMVFFSMMFAIAAMLPLMELLLGSRLFSGAVVDVAAVNLPEKTGRRWRKGAVITMLIAAITYPFMTQLGHGLLPLPENIFRMTIGNGFVSWYLLLIIIMLATTIVPWRKAKKAGKPKNFVQLGLGDSLRPDRFSAALLGKGLLLAACMIAQMYLLVVLYNALFLLDLRFIWPFFKVFTGERFLQFLVYFPIFAIFFLLNNSKIFAQGRVVGTSTPGLKGFLQCWWKYAMCMVGGILLLILLEYIPFFAGIGPGADLLFGSTFGGPFMSLMIVFVPQVVVFSVLCTCIYRRTGQVYTSAFTVAAMAAWIVTGGSAIL